jgi:ubiquinone/menaquinone biosynthesis C-methylase UbiE
LKTNEEWKVWGKEDPFYGVASWPGRWQGVDNEWNDVDFFNLGKSDWSDFSKQWSYYGYTQESCLEIGSGAGRITKWLSEQIHIVHAVDVSKDMLNYARRYVKGDHVNWYVTDGTSIPLQNSLEFPIFSFHVFQLCPSVEDGLIYFKEIQRVLKPGGTMMIHLPLHNFSIVNKKFSNFVRFLSSLFLILTSVKADIGCWLMRRGEEKYMHGISYEASQL